MNTGILIIAHAPLASALRAGVLHVFPDVADGIIALDVPPSEPTETTILNARAMLAQLQTPNTLVLTDVFGATPCNVAQKVVDGLAAKLPNDPMPDQLRGRLALQAKDVAAARGHFDAALAKNADYLPALAGLATLDIVDKKPDA